jgi:hypothetical protein
MRVETGNPLVIPSVFFEGKAAEAGPFDEFASWYFWLKNDFTI